MTTLTVPSDPRAQYALSTIAVATALSGRSVMDRMQRVGPDAYVLAPESPPDAGISPSVLTASIGTMR
jgi:hypothetical protein